MSECPLCEEFHLSLEFHHWDYDADIGIEVCRECHNAIHGGADGRVSVQQNRVEYYGGDHWHEAAVRNLIERDLRFGGIGEIDVEVGKFRPLTEPDDWQQYLSDSWGKYKDYIEEQYNLPPDWRETANGCEFCNIPAQFRFTLKTGRWR
jgi:hypothetical protein